MGLVNSSKGDARQTSYHSSLKCFFTACDSIPSQVPTSRRVPLRSNSRNSSTVRKLQSTPGTSPSLGGRVVPERKNWYINTVFLSSVKTDNKNDCKDIMISIKYNSALHRARTRVRNPRKNKLRHKSQAELMIPLVQPSCHQQSFSFTKTASLFSDKTTSAAFLFLYHFFSPNILSHHKDLFSLISTYYFIYVRGN